jgi:hypothetical protein
LSFDSATAPIPWHTNRKIKNFLHFDMAPAPTREMMWLLHHTTDDACRKCLTIKNAFSYIATFSILKKCIRGLADCKDLSRIAIGGLANLEN